MDAGIFKDRVQLLEYDAQAGQWIKAREIWCQARREGKANLFSKIGVGAEGWRFTMRRQQITLHNALFAGGYHHVITSIEGQERMYAIVCAARVRLTQVSRGPELGSFPAVLSEKWAGYSADAAKSTSEDRLVMTTPKAERAAVNDVLTIDGEYWYVELAHELDEYKNEYEIVRKRDN